MVGHGCLGSEFEGWNGCFCYESGGRNCSGRAVLSGEDVVATYFSWLWLSV